MALGSKKVERDKQVNLFKFFWHGQYLFPRTLELLHDRSSPLEIKMFLTLNINIGRTGASRKQNLMTLDDGTTEVVSHLIEAFDNLVAI